MLESLRAICEKVGGLRTVEVAAENSQIGIPEAVLNSWLDWLKQAEEDEVTCRVLYQAGRYDAACFYAQQSAEKAAKSLLYAQNEQPWGHSVAKLLQEFLSLVGEENETLISQGRELDRHYIPTRYPGALPEGTPAENYDEPMARRALEFLASILSVARERLNADGGDG